MESEEYEQIPWANLMAEARPTVDPRLYVVGGVVAVIVAIVLAGRMLGSPAPSGATTVAFEEPATTVVGTLPEMVEPTAVVVSEADLMATIEPAIASVDPIAVLTAEWFVTDYFTRDGSAETLASLEGFLPPALAAALPHHTHEAPDQFVEWAKVFGVTPSDHGLDVSVAFRTVSGTDEGFVRDPVQAVAVGIEQSGPSWMVISLPINVPVP